MTGGALKGRLKSFARRLGLRRPPPFLGLKVRALVYRLVYTRASLASMPDWAGYRVPESCLYLNAFGRLLFSLQQRLYLRFGLRERLAIQLEHFDDVDYGRLYGRGSHQRLWPVAPFVETAQHRDAATEGLMTRLQTSYSLAYTHDARRLSQSPWWKTMTGEFQEHFFENDKTIKRDTLVNFRRRATSKAAIISDQLDTIVPQKSFEHSYRQSLGLVLRYHKRSEWVDHATLASVSESFSGNNLCPVYRGQRLSRRLLLHAYYLSQIRKHTGFRKDDSFSILDLGGAYGGLVRLLSLYYTNCRAFLIELPEICVLAGYFLSQALPRKRIVVLSELDLDDLKAGRIDLSRGDVFVLPTWVIEHLPDKCIDLVINTTSLGEMSMESGQYYIRHIERLTRGYFYSCNRSFSDMSKYDDFNFYNWNFQERWHTILYQLNHAGKLEWLGQCERQEDRHGRRA